jgi:hypothetical protein
MYQSYTFQFLCIHSVLIYKVEFLNFIIMHIIYERIRMHMVFHYICVLCVCTGGLFNYKA